MKSQRYRIDSRRKPQPRLFIKRLNQGLCFVLIFFAVGYCVIWCLDPKHFPITSVRFIGIRNYLSQEEIRAVVLPEIKVGFFRLKVSTLKSRLLSLPWMKQVDIRKVWPDQLTIVFEEHTPRAFWGESGVISENGVLFLPAPTKAIAFQKSILVQGSHGRMGGAKQNTFLEGYKPQNLPRLEGPEGKSSLVWEQYLVMEKTLAPLHLSITALKLAPRGAWHLGLSNGMKVVLGTNDILERLERFVRVYEKHLKRHVQEISYVDMRYTSGMAVGWKS